MILAFEVDGVLLFVFTFALAVVIIKTQIMLLNDKRQEQNENIHRCIVQDMLELVIGEK